LIAVILMSVLLLISCSEGGSADDAAERESMSELGRILDDIGGTSMDEARAIQVDRCLEAAGVPAADRAAIAEGSTEPTEVEGFGVAQQVSTIDQLHDRVEALYGTDRRTGCEHKASEVVEAALSGLRSELAVELARLEMAYVRLPEDGSTRPDRYLGADR
jgi:hypothetical protein